MYKATILWIISTKRILPFLYAKIHFILRTDFSRAAKIAGFMLTIAVLCINMYFAITYIGEIPIHNWALYTFLGFVLFLYLAFISYLVSK